MEENQLDLFEPNTYFQMVFHYYLCELKNTIMTMQKLDAYEADLDFKSVWITIEEAIQVNEASMNKEGSNPWVKRETSVLKKLINESTTLKELISIRK